MLFFWNTFLWRILILYPSHTSLFLEIVTIKFWGLRTQGWHMEPRAEKNKYPRIIKFLNFCSTLIEQEIEQEAYITFTQPAWDIFEMSQSDLHWEKHLKDLPEISQKRRLFCDVFKTSQIHLKKDVFHVTSLRRLKHISKKMFILWRLWYISKISLESICDYSKISHKSGFVLIK